MKTNQHQCTTCEHLSHGEKSKVGWSKSGVVLTGSINQLKLPRSILQKWFILVNCRSIEKLRSIEFLAVIRKIGISFWFSLWWNLLKCYSWSEYINCWWFIEKTEWSIEFFSGQLKNGDIILVFTGGIHWNVIVYLSAKNVWSLPRVLIG